MDAVGRVVSPPWRIAAIRGDVCDASWRLNLDVGAPTIPYLDDMDDLVDRVDLVDRAPCRESSFSSPGKISFGTVARGATVAPRSTGLP